jgi:hypothetical protein
MIIVPQTTTVAIRRGRQIGLDIANAIRDHREAGRKPVAVRVSSDVAADMRAFFAVACQDFDNVLPRTVLGVPFSEGGTAGQDVVIEIEHHRPS